MYVKILLGMRHYPFPIGFFIYISGEDIFHIDVVLVSRNIELWHSIFLSQSVSVSPYCFCNKLLHWLPGKELRYEPGYD